MNLDRTRELLELDNELDTFGLLRKHMPSHQLYKVDRRMQLVAMIERSHDTEDDCDLKLLSEG
jgi:hypothetical protein